MTAAVFFDRDGTLNEEVGAVRARGDIRVLAGAADAVRLVRAAGLKAVMVTNQSAVARGETDEAEVAAACAEVADACGGFDAIYWCPHHPSEGRTAYRQDCACRKPRPGMVLDAAREHALDLARSVMIGDAMVDLLAARAAGVRAILVLTGKGPAERERAASLGLAWDHEAADVLAAVRWWLAGSMAGELP